MELVYNTGEKVRVKECKRLACTLLLTDGVIDANKCRDLILSTPIRLGWIKEKDTEYLSIRYKDINIEFCKVVNDILVL